MSARRVDCMLTCWLDMVDRVMAAVVGEVAGRKGDGKEECGSAGRRASGCGATGRRDATRKSRPVPHA